MKRVFFIKDSTENTITYFHLLFFMVLLPFDRQYSTLVLLSLLAHSLIFINRQKIQQVGTSVLLLQSVFFVTLVSTGWSAFRSSGMSIASKQLAILLFPLVFATTALNLARYKQRLLYGFTGACIITVLYLYYDALHIIFFNRLPVGTLFSGAFVNHNFSLAIGMHATYLSALMVLAITWLLQQLLKNTIQHRPIAIAALLVLLAGLLQLGSKSALIALFIIVVVGFPALVIQNHQRRKFFLLAVPALLGLLIIVLSVDSYRTRYLRLLKSDLHENAGAESNARIDRWAAALELIQRAPAAGTGSGSEIPLLRELYFTKKMYADYLYSLNVHNQYLSFLITAGAAGLLVYLFTLAWGWRQVFREKSILLFSFMTVVSVVSFAEDMLDVNKGIFFYAFFFSFFAMPQRSLQTGFIFTGRQPAPPIAELLQGEALD